MIEIRPACVADLDGFEGRRFDRAWIERLRGILPQLSGPAITGAIDGRVAMIAGIEPLWSGVGEAWAVTTPLVDRHRAAIARKVAAELPRQAADLGLHRLQAAVHDDHVRSRRWLEWMGFEPEGLMQGYGPDGAPYWRYARRFARPSLFS